MNPYQDDNDGRNGRVHFVSASQRKRSVGWKIKEYVVIPAVIVGAVAALAALPLPAGREYTGKWRKVEIKQAESVDLLAGRHCRDSPLYREDWWKNISQKNGLGDSYSEYTCPIINPRDSLWVPDSTDVRNPENYRTVKTSLFSELF